MGAVGESVVLGVRRREQNALVNRENIRVLTLLLLVFGRSVEQKLRHYPSLGNGYARRGSEDDALRFVIPNHNIVLHISRYDERLCGVDINCGKGCNALHK